MRLINQIREGSLLSHERMMEAREHYSPTSGALSPEQAFARWTQRISIQSELGSAREIAGLTEEELSAMEAEFFRCPRHPGSSRARSAVPTGLAVAAIGATGLVMQALLRDSSTAGYQAVQMASATCVLIGLVLLAIGVVSAFSTLHLELCHGTAGLYFGRLDEEHPWLFKTMNLTYHPAAEAYRQRVLQERGWLRGVDYVMMRETVRVHDATDRTLSTRLMAEKIQLLPVPDGEASIPNARLPGEREGRRRKAQE